MTNAIVRARGYCMIPREVSPIKSYVLDEKDEEFDFSYEFEVSGHDGLKLDMNSGYGLTAGDRKSPQKIAIKAASPHRLMSSGLSVSGQAGKEVTFALRREVGVPITIVLFPDGEEGEIVLNFKEEATYLTKTIPSLTAKGTYDISG